ncbi:Aspartate aminotransferase, cytoplasmic [Coccidioides posadasii str. Silveira]|uniref:Aspartate aminotransferase n=2 Tax=Coccidioides posadasii TaxID=199306 RepID=E9DCW0_COCPS|nr:aspartate aminotransferase [Coccidioides posadasii str. Silveira]KMM69344.1 aspartate aminotransferase [Coccidioides posadasii RMSCC 3488]QVM09543.1 Aspartate aminotransferase, cytoplasmic [Coccidioides posadasii str. Silveira]
MSPPPPRPSLSFTPSSSSPSSSLSLSHRHSSKSTSSTALSTAQSRLSTISKHIMASSSSSPSIFTANVVPKAPEDPLFGLMRAYRADPSDKKVDLGIGAYRDDNAKPWILPVVRKADEAIRNDPTVNHEYLPIAGLPDLAPAAQKLILGADSPAITEKRVTTFQTISGTGAVHLGGLFLSKFYPANPKPAIYLSSPTWANHQQIFTNVNLTTAYYPYYSAQTKGLDIDGMLAAIRAAPQGSIFVLHACAHNPTGVDPTQDQWKQIAAAMRERNHFPFFDTAYQGFASGDLARDAWSIRYFVEQGFELCVAQSFAKNFGLYGERAGAFHFVSAPGPHAADSTAHIASQLAILQRSEISNPPAYGARIASLILNSEELFAEWEADLRTMSGRIMEMRKGLRERLEQKGTPGTWEHITNQIGMFSFTGLTEQQVGILREKWHVYMTKNGRISMAGLNTHNIDYFAEAVDSVVRETSS